MNDIVQVFSLKAITDGKKGRLKKVSGRFLYE